MTQTDTVYRFGRTELVRVKRWQDALVLHCNRCDTKVAEAPDPYWHLGKSAGLHGSNGTCTKKDLVFYGFPKTEDNQ